MLVRACVWLSCLGLRTTRQGPRLASEHGTPPWHGLLPPVVQPALREEAAPAVEERERETEVGCQTDAAIAPLAEWGQLTHLVMLAAFRFLPPSALTTDPDLLKSKLVMSVSPLGSDTQYLILHLREQKQNWSLHALLQDLHAFSVFVGFGWGLSLKKITRDPLMMYVCTPLVSKYLWTSCAFTTSWYTYLLICSTSCVSWSLRQCWQKGLQPQVVQKKVQSLFLACLCFSHTWKKSLFTSSKSHLRYMATTEVGGVRRDRKLELERASVGETRGEGRGGTTASHLIVFLAYCDLLRPAEGLSASIFTCARNEHNEHEKSSSVTRASHVARIPEGAYPVNWRRHGVAPSSLLGRSSAAGTLSTRRERFFFVCLLVVVVESFLFRFALRLFSRRAEVEEGRRSSAQSYSPLDERPALRAIGSRSNPLAYLPAPPLVSRRLDRARCR